MKTEYLLISIVLKLTEIRLRTTDKEARELIQLLLDFITNETKQ